MVQVLEGLTVLDLTGGVAGPMTTMLMSDYGATVIKVEPPGGDPFRSHPGYLAWNRGKKSVVLDLKDPAQRDQFLQLAARADVLIESFSPGTTANLGIDYDRLHQENPRLIYCSITGYGRNNTLSQRPAYDALVQARTGLMYEQRSIKEEWDGPVFLHQPMPSLGAAYLASTAINAALHAREVTGQGQWVETSLLQGSLTWTTMLWIRLEDAPDGFYNTFRYREFPPTPTYVAADGKWFHPMTGGNPATVQAAGLPDDFLHGSARGDYGERKIARRGAEAVFQQLPRDEWVQWHWDNDFSCQPSHSPVESFTDPQILANDLIGEVDVPGIGVTKQFVHPYHLEHSDASIKGPPPAVGQHTQEVLASLKAPAIAGAATAQAPQTLNHPLEGIRVLDLGIALAGPYAPALLGDLGAEVIKVIAPASDGANATRGDSNQVYFGCQRGKRCIALDLKTEEGREVLYDLIRTADVLHYNLRVGVAERLGYGYETVKKINPRLIFCHTTAYGETGPYATYPGVDQMGQALSGLEWEQGATDAGGHPQWSQFGYCDASNAFISVIAVLQALYHRDKTGDGQFVGACIVNGATFNAADAVLLPSGELAPRLHLDKEQTGLGPLYRFYETQTGWICIAVVKDAEWRALGDTLGQPALADDPRFATVEARAENADALTGLLRSLFYTRTAEDWFQQLDAAGVPCEIVSDSFRETWYDDPDMIANGLVAKYPHATAGLTEQYGLLFNFSATPGKIWGAPPIVGEHTTEILESLGYDAARIRDLQESGIAPQAELVPVRR